MRNKVLLDANIIIRFFEGGSALHYEKSVEIIEEISEGKIKALLLDLVIAEIIYVSRRIYKREKMEISTVLREMILMEHLYVENQPIVLEALTLYAVNNIDFADAILCAKKRLEGFEVLSYDKDVKKC